MDFLITFARPKPHMGIMIGLFLATFLTFVQYNCENLFDCVDDSLKQDEEFLPTSPRRWTNTRYWQKVRNVARCIASCGDGDMRAPDLITLCEVENDSVVDDLVNHSQLREMRYGYIVTNSPDPRGIDVALIYNKFVFKPINSYPLRVDFKDTDHQLRHVLYVSGETISGDTLHILVVHAPSRYGGTKASSPRREAMANRVIQAIDSIRNISPEANIIVSGDFNDGAEDTSLKMLEDRGLSNIGRNAVGKANGTPQTKVKGSYRYQGVWGSIDHILISNPIIRHVSDCYINAQKWLLEKDKKYGGVKPRRTFNGYKFRKDGYSDHLPVVLRLEY